MRKFQYDGSSGTIHLLLDIQNTRLEAGDTVDVDDRMAAALEKRTDFREVVQSVRKAKPIVEAEQEPYTGS
jgi:hypothetical protein